MQFIIDADLPRTVAGVIADFGHESVDVRDIAGDTGEGSHEYLKGLAPAEGIETPTRQDVTKLDRKRAHKAEHTIDLDTQALVAIQVGGADEGDTASLPWRLLQASMNLEASLPDEGKPPPPLLSEVGTDKGYHRNDTAKTLKRAQIRRYLSEPDRGRRRWKKEAEAPAAVYANRRRLRGPRGPALQRLRAEYTERSFTVPPASGHSRLRTNLLRRFAARGNVI